MAKIMVVDDSEALRSQLRKLLEGASHEVFEAFDGQNGIEALSARSDIEIVFCDINMPRMDGLKMIEKFRELPAYKSTPVFMLTTESSPEMKARGKAAGVLAWITKPFQQDKLLGAVNYVMKGKSAT